VIHPLVILHDLYAIHTFISSAPVSSSLGGNVLMLRSSSSMVSRLRAV
jgi:hypothetical protein